MVIGRRARARGRFRYEGRERGGFRCGIESEGWRKWRELIGWGCIFLGGLVVAVLFLMIDRGHGGFGDFSCSRINIFSCQGSFY